LFDKDQVRERTLYDGGIAGNIPTSFQERRQRYGARLMVGLKGTF